MTNMIPNQIQLIHNVPDHDTVTRRQQSRRRREAQRQRQEQQRQQPQQQARGQRFTTWFEDEWDHDYCQYLGVPEYMDEIHIEPLLDVYSWGKMDQKGRWEQEQLLELEGFPVVEQLALIQDELEQIQQIEDAQILQQEEQQQQNQDQLIQLQQWEHIAFLLQQFNHN